MKFILGTKVHMIQVFDEDGSAHAATVLRVAPNTVTMIRTKEKDGYVAAQIGAGKKAAKNVSKPVLGHLKELGPFATIREFRPTNTDGEAAVAQLTRGATIDVSLFAPGDIVTVSAISKGKGFQGVVKRHGFKGDSRTHGRKHSERAPGSIGGGGRAGGRVVKGMRMAGRMGGERVTVKNLKVLGVDSDNNELLIKGAIPGRRGTVVEVRTNE